MELDPRTLIVASLLTAGLMGAVSVAFATLRGHPQTAWRQHATPFAAAPHPIRPE
jgi:hypothetical protein